MVRSLRSWMLGGGVCAILCATTALAQSTEQATGLGQSWPNSTDVSASPHYHVYVFSKGGIRYFQVNDLNGTVRAAVAVADGVILTLPIGLDTAQVTHIANRQVNGSSEILYSDQSVTLTAAHSQDGHNAFNVVTPDMPPICPQGSGNDCSVSGITGQGNLSNRN